MAFERLTRDDLAAFFGARSSRMRGSLFDLSIQTHAGKKVKMACIVPKKAMPRAVDRNKTRRRVRSILAQLDLPHIPVALVFTARAEAKASPFAAIEKDVRRLVEKALAQYNTRI